MESAINIDNLSNENNNLCRVCLLTNEENKCIFTSQINFHREIYSPTNLREKLQFYGGIEVAPNDGLPGKMCTECLSRLRAAHEFRTQCQATDSLLRSVHNNSVNKMVAASGWLREIQNEDQRESVQSNKIVKLEELYGDDSNANNLEVSDAQRTMKNAGIQFSSRIEKTEDVNLPPYEDLPQGNEILVPKKIKRVATENSWQSYEKSAASPISEGKSSVSISLNSVNDLHGDAAKGRKDKSLATKKDEYRSRRLSLFKRATSMTNLRHNKERQRQYIKKTLFTKFESSDRDNFQNGKTSSAGSRHLPVTLGNSHHKCSKCGRSFSSQAALKSHEISHEHKKFSCDHCDERFSRIDEFLKHAKIHDSSEKLKPASCKICNKNFRKAVTMVRHLNVHKRENPRAVYNILKDIRDRRRAKVSGEDNARLENLNDKIIFPDNRENRVNRELECSPSNPRVNRGCASETSSANSNSVGDTRTFDETRSSSRDEVKFVCDACAATFFTADKLKSHRACCKRYADDANWGESPPDDRSAIKLINIWIKEELDSDNEGKVFPCDSCSKSYATNKSLLKHREKVHSDVTAERCSRCGQDCACALGEKTQKDTHEKSFACEECDKTFEKEARLEKHLRIHARAKEQQDTNFKRFLCHICSKTFRQNTGLMFHMRTHTGYKPHVCKYCGRGFTSNSNCINHERTHTGDRPFVCHFCSAAFAKSCTLKAHITTHTGEANYHCKTCGKSFRRLKYLKEHRFTHTGEKPYACKICGTAYSHSGSLFVHEKKCRAQEGNYQTLSESITQNYRQPLAATNGTSPVAPIATSLLSSHRIISMDDQPLTSDTTKNYIENVPTINNSLVHPAGESAATQIHLHSDAAEAPPAVTSFTIVGQMFHT